MYNFLALLPRPPTPSRDAPSPDFSALSCCPWTPLGSQSRAHSPPPHQLFTQRSSAFCAPTPRPLQRL